MLCVSDEAVEFTTLLITIVIQEPHQRRWGSSPYQRHVLVSRIPSKQHGLVPTPREERKVVRD